MKNKNYGPLGIILQATCLLIAETMSSHAAVTQFTNRSVWEAAAGGGVGDIVDNLNSGNLDRGTYVISGTGQAAFPNANITTTVDGSNHLRALLDSSVPNFITITFDSPVLAMGYDVNPFTATANPANNVWGQAIAFEINGIFAGIYNLPASETSEFRGFISDVPITTFKITAVTGAPWHGIDNVEAFGAAIPEPTSAVMLLGSGAMLLGRRRRAATQASHSEV